MHLILESKHTCMIRFDKDEDIIEKLTGFCSVRHIAAGSFQAIGAASEVFFSYYNLETKRYEDKIIQEDVEITGIFGNVAKLNNELIVHCHGTVSNRNFQVIGGHVKKLIVSATCEMSLHILEGIIERQFDEKTGLNLMR